MECGVGCIGHDPRGMAGTVAGTVRATRRDLPARPPSSRGQQQGYEDRSGLKRARRGECRMGEGGAHGGGEAGHAIKAPLRGGAEDVEAAEVAHAVALGGRQGCADVWLHRGVRMHPQRRDQRRAAARARRVRLVGRERRRRPAPLGVSPQQVCGMLAAATTLLTGPEEHLGDLLLHVQH